jgi:hypothetical protein
MKLILLLDGTSTVTFMPYIALNFYKEYLIPNYIGESLAGLIPSALSLVQGLGADPGCYNYTDPSSNLTRLKPRDIKPNFTVSLYFLFMFGLVCVCTFSFTMLNFSKFGKRERNKKRGDLALMGTSTQIKNPSAELDTTLGKTSVERILLWPFQLTPETREKLFLWTQVFMMSFFYYGILPSLQSYSTLPYSKTIANC